MTDFYRDLSSEALADENSDASEADLNKMIGDMDDLDANLFGTPAVKSSSAVPIPSGPKPAKLQAASLHQSLDSDWPTTASSSTKQPAKSRLLAELFGPSDSYSPSADVSTKLITPSSRADTFDLTSPRPKTTPPKDESSVYRPTSVPRERRRQATTVASADDMWTKFLQPSSVETVLQTVNKEPPSAMKVELSLSPVRSKSPVHSPARRSPVKTVVERADWSQPKPLSADDLLVLLRPHIEEMIAGEVEKLHVADVQTSAGLVDLESRVSELSASNLKLQREHEEQLVIIEELQRANEEQLATIEELQRARKEQIATKEEQETTIEELQGQIEEQQKSLREVRDKADSEERARQRRLDLTVQELRGAVAAAQEHSSQQVAALHGQVTQLQRRVQEGRDLLESSQSDVEASIVKSSRLLSQQLSATLASLRSELREDLHISQTQLAELERRCAEERSQWGAELGRLQSKLTASRRPWEEDLEMRVEHAESSLGARLAHANKQQARLGAWHEKQLSDLADYMEQRLWSLYHLQRRELQAGLSQPCAEAAALRRLVSQQEKGLEERDATVRALETRVTGTEEEACRLARLAERLCGVLQMWEQRHKGAARAEAENLLSLQERFNMAIIERGLGKN